MLEDDIFHRHNHHLILFDLVHIHLCYRSDWIDRYTYMYSYIDSLFHGFSQLHDGQIAARRLDTTNDSSLDAVDIW